jgi:type II secretion system protein N
MPESTPYTELPLQKKVAYILALVALCSGAFVLGMWFMFPDASLERRLNAEISRQVPFEVRIHQLERSFPFTLRASRVEVDAPQFPVTIASLRVKPAWGSLIKLQAGVHASGQMFDGSFDVIHTGSGATEISAESMSLSVDIPGFSSIRVEADLAYAHLKAQVSDVVTPQEGSLVLKQVRIHGLDTLGLGQKVINLGDLELVLKERERLLEVELLNPQGDFQLSGSGSITPPRLTPSSRLNLQLRIGSIPPEHGQLEELLSLTGVRKDAQGYLIRLGGRLQRPFLR